MLGLLVTWITIRYEFPGRRLLDSVVDLPFALPTSVAGVSLTALVGPNGPVGQWLEPLGIHVAYAWPGIVLAMTFTTFPFIIRSLQPVLADLDRHAEEAAFSLGAGPFTTFHRVIFPELLPALLAGSTLAFVRALGEFGAIIFISGNLPYKTEVSSLLIFTRITEYDYTGAAALAFVILMAAFLILLAMNIIQHLFYRRLNA
jgi:sulfate transport system permease protein